MLTYKIQLLNSFCFRWFIAVNPARSIWTEWGSILGQWIPCHTLHIVQMSIQNLMNRTWWRNSPTVSIKFIYLNKNSFKLDPLLFLTFVNIPYDARIINRTRNQKRTISRPLQVQYILTVKSEKSKPMSTSIKLEIIPGQQWLCSFCGLNTSGEISSFKKKLAPTLGGISYQWLLQ